MRLINSSTRRWIIWVALVSAIIGWAGCSKKSASDEGESPDKGADTIAEVTLTHVTRADISAMLAVTGTISALPNQDVKVSSLVPGRVARLNVTEGDYVRQGEVLAAIEDRPYQDQLRQAEAAVAQAKANLENAKLNRDRNETLFQRGIAARKDVEDARTQVTVNEAALSQAEAQASLARLQISRAQVVSPLAGVVVKRFVSDGEQVDGTAAQPIFEVANLHPAELFANVPADYLGRIHTGQTLPISTDAFPGKVFSGRVVAISPAVDASTNVGLVRIRIENREGLLRLGIFLSASIPLETHPKALVVPPQAVYRDEQGEPRVFQVEGRDATAVPVKLGIENADKVELLSGVKEGDTVILAGGYGLGDKAKIKVQP
ncbi:MAG TPA: efflux RND transporter periplasmic adaptor subunit [Terriglobia bacterium]|nr:efflux RND transporter periplasmic adaptor subunit [Terriglobia bacterium]